MNERARAAMEFSKLSRSPRSRSPRWEENKRRVLAKEGDDGSRSRASGDGGSPAQAHRDLTDSFHSSTSPAQAVGRSFSSEDTSLAGGPRIDRQDLSSLAYVPVGPLGGATAADSAAQGYPTEPGPGGVTTEYEDDSKTRRIPARPGLFRHQDSVYADPMARLNGHGKWRTVCLLPW